MASNSENELGSPGEYLPTLFSLGLFATLWGVVLLHDGSMLIGLVIFPPMVLGVLSAAALQMFLGRGRGGFLMVGGGGLFLYLGSFGMAMVVTMLRGSASGDPLVWEPLSLGIGFVCGLLGCVLGALALSHYVVIEQEAEEDFDEEEDTEVEEDVDYTTEPEDLVCLLTNQVINRDHDNYVVCHNRLNVSQVCHAVYLKDYVHLLENRCRRCYQSIRERDGKGMRRG